jgi:hypothetical protein
MCSFSRIAIQWLHIMIWSFGLGCVMEGLGPALVPLVFLICLIYNITGGWNIDLADQGYKVWQTNRFKILFFFIRSFFSSSF